jgi:hypothetical protein
LEAARGHGVFGAAAGMLGAQQELDGFADEWAALSGSAATDVDAIRETLLTNAVYQISTPDLVVLDEVFSSPVLSELRDALRAPAASNLNSQLSAQIGMFLQYVELMQAAMSERRMTLPVTGAASSSSRPRDAGWDRAKLRETFGIELREGEPLNMVSGFVSTQAQAAFEEMLTSGAKSQQRSRLSINVAGENFGISERLLNDVTRASYVLFDRATGQPVQFGAGAQRQDLNQDPRPTIASALIGLARSPEQAMMLSQWANLHSGEALQQLMHSELSPLRMHGRPGSLTGQVNMVFEASPQPHDSVLFQAACKIGLPQDGSGLEGGELRFVPFDGSPSTLLRPDSNALFRWNFIVPAQGDVQVDPLHIDFKAEPLDA